MLKEPSPDARRLAKESGPDDLDQVFSKFGLDGKTLSLLSLHLYEIHQHSLKYMRLYESLFDRPEGTEEEREHLGDTLIEIKILTEDIEWHLKELRELADRAADILLPDS